jgi:hypothetical protein
MAVTNLLFAHFPENLGGGDTAGEGPMDLLSDTLKQTLHTSTWTPNQSTNQVKADATNELTTVNGYTALGVALGTKTYVSSALVTTFDAADTSWVLSGPITFRHAPIWNDTPTSPADPLILNIDTGGDQTINGATLTMQFNASGIWTFTVS